MFQSIIFPLSKEWYLLPSNPLLLRFTIFTFTEALITVIGSLIIGVPTGYLLARTSPYKIKFYRTLITVPFIFPPLAMLLGLVLVYEPNGFIGSIIGSTYTFTPFSFWGIIIAHLMYNISVIARITETSLLNEPLNYHDLAKTLGASRWKRFFTITLPHIRPSIESAVLLVFLYAFNSFAVVLILGEIRLQTIEVMIYYQSKIRFRYDRAAVLAFYQLILNLLIIGWYIKRRNYQKRDVETLNIPPNKSTFLPTILLSLVALFLWFPVILVFRSVFIGFRNAPQSLQERIFSDDYNEILGTSSLRVIGNTILFALLVAIVTIIFGMLLVGILHTSTNRIRTERMYSLLILLPMGTSAISLSFAILYTFSRSSIFNKYVWLFILSAHLLASLPFTSRIIIARWDRIPQDFIIVSQTLGANSWLTFKKIIFPQMRSALLISFLFAFAISFGEFGATNFLVRGEWTTLSIAINRLFTSRNNLLPLFYASLLITIAFLLFWLIEKYGNIELRL